MKKHEVAESILDMGLTTHQICAALVMLHHANHQTFKIYASIETLAYLSGMHRSTFDRSLKALIGLNVVKKHYMNRSIRLKFNQISEWSLDCDSKVITQTLPKPSSNVRHRSEGLSNDWGTVEEQMGNDWVNNAAQGINNSPNVRHRSELYIDVVENRVDVGSEVKQQHPAATDFDSQFTSTNAMDWENQIIGQMRNCGYEITIAAAQTVMRKYKARGGEMYACVSWVGDRAVDYQARRVPQNRVARYLVQDVERAKIIVTIKQNEPSLDFIVDS
jgi:hypothetical protein